MLNNKDYCDYDTCVALKELGYNQPSIAFYPCQDIIVDCIDSNGELYEAEYDKGNLVLYSSLNNKNHDINKVQAPLLYEAQKWLREEKHIDALVYLDDLKGYFPFIKIWEGSWKTFIILEEMEDKKVSYFVNYEEALAEAVRQAVKILKEK